MFVEATAFFSGFRRVTPITAKSLVPLDPFFLTIGAPRIWFQKTQEVNTTREEIFPGDVSNHQPKRRLLSSFGSFSLRL